MRSRLCYRAASILFVVFALGHTIGFLRFSPPTAEGRAVFEAMSTVRFDVGGVNHTYRGFYVGFGLFVSAYLFFSALLAWQLGRLSEKAREEIAMVSLGFLAVQVVNVALCAIYFGPVQVIFAAVVVGLLAAAGWPPSFLRLRAMGAWSAS